MRRSAFGHVLVLLTAFGCNEIAGIKDPVGSVSPDAFVGTWTSNDRAVTLLDCASAGSASSLAGSLVVAKGTSAALDFIVGGGCHLNASIDGETARLLPGQGCVFAAQGTAPAQTLLYDVSTFQLQSGSSTRASVHLTGEIRFEPVGAPQEICVYDEVGTYTKP
ncbi:hypothetical protein BH11MYX4_BH11MYX4_53800 [soil metagenome]